MVRIHLCAATIALLGLAVSADQGFAQFGSLFGAPPPPRPPSAVPNRGPGAPAQPLQPSPPPQAPQTGLDPVVAPSGGAAIQSQPLPPAGQPQGKNQPRGNPPGTAAIPPQPGDEGFVELPTQKIANPTAIFSGLDKITGRIISFDVAINETVQFGALQVTPRVCYTRPPTETPNTDAFIEVDEVTLQGEVKRIFSGWIFASSPGLHALEHPIYDVWLTDCKGAPSAVASTTPTAPTPAATTPRAGTPNPNAPRQPGATTTTQPPQRQQQAKPAQPPSPFPR